MIFKDFEFSSFLVVGAEQDLLEHNLIPKGFADSLLWVKEKIDLEKVCTCAI